MSDTSPAEAGSQHRSAGRAQTRALLSHGPVRLLFGARSVSLLGDFLVPVALATALLQNGGGPTDLGLVLAARSVPGVVFLLLGGAVGDRLSRRHVMVVAESVACLSQLALGVVILTGRLSVPLVAALVAVRATTSAFFNPAATGAIADVTPSGLLQRAYGLFGTAATAAELLGPAVAGGLLIWLSPGCVIIADGMTFAVSAALVWRLPLSRPRPSAERPPLRRELLGGFVHLRRERWLGVLILSACAFQFFFITSLDVLGPSVIADIMGTAAGWSVLMVAFGIGATAGSLLGMQWRVRQPLVAACTAMVCLSGPALVALALEAPLWMLAVSQMGAGLAMGLFNVLEQYTIAERVPTELMARVDSVNRLGSSVLRPAGMAMVGPVAGLLGTGHTLLLAAAAATIAMAVPLAVSDVRALRRR
ncbi:MFS transporter [Streptomyces roseofulvus]|uniref:MFS transporter n=1 Tax=Streptomyces roseofulvus TaxID=33902 RepID=UPI0031FBBD7D